MKRLSAVVIFVVVFASIAYGDWFPITAWGIADRYDSDTIWVDSVKVWNGNSLLCNFRPNGVTEELLEEGKEDTIQCIVGWLTKEYVEDSHYVSLSVMARGQFSTYQSEEHDPQSVDDWPPAHGYFGQEGTSCVGSDSSDPYASNGEAWFCNTSDDTLGYMQRALRQHGGHLQEFYHFPWPLSDLYPDSLKYEARFFLRVNDDTSNSDTVCRLEVWTEEDTLPFNHDSLLASRILIKSEITNTASYDTFKVSFFRDGSMPKDGRMDYCIWWYDNYDLFADKVEVRDAIYDSLETGEYNNPIADIVEYWRDFDALKYYYLWDEPSLDQLKAFQLVKGEMGQSNPIACVSPRYGSNKYNFYGEFIKTCYQSDTDTPLLVNRYFLKPSDITSAAIQEKFTNLCAWMDTVRVIADTTGSPDPHRNVWYACQAHSWIKENGDTVWRNPTPQEEWALVGLGLAHGAKGIWYYRYHSLYYDTLYDYLAIQGLVEWNADSSKWMHNEKWEAIQRVNAVLQKIDTFLLDFEFQNAFSGGDVPQNYIKSTSFDTTEFGLFEDSDDLEYFLVVSRRDTFSSVADTASDSTLITLGLDGSLHSGWYYIRDCYSGEPYRYDSTSSGEAPDKLYFNFYLKDCHFKLFQIVPFTCDVEINADSSYTDYPFVKVYFDTITGATFDDSMYVRMWSDEGDTIEDVKTDSTLIWKFQSPGSKILTASLKLFESNYIQGDSGYLTPTYWDTIYLDTIPPSSNSLEVEYVDTLAGFVNKDSVNLSLSSTDAAGIPVRKMRFSNYSFNNLIQNPDFSDTTYWVCVDSATIDSGYGEIDGDFGGVIFQNIDDSLFVEEKVYRLSVHVVTDSFISDSGRIQLTYLYADTVDGDTSSGSLKTIELSDGDQALTGYNCISDTFTYVPSPSQGSNDTTLGCRLEIHQNNNGNGRLIIDNFLLEREYTESCWHDYDTTYSDWVLTSGDGEKVVSGVFRDAAGNITNEVADTVILDKTLPIDTITSPRPMQIISGKINIRGWAHDSASAEQHFYYYKLEYKPTLGGTWNDCDTIEYYYEPKYPDSSNGPPSVVLGEWNTSYAQNGIYYLRLSVVDSASNLDSTRIIVSVNNQGKEGSGEFKAGKEPTGISWSSHLYVTDIMDGDLRRYNLKGDSIGYISLIKDSVGISKPCAVATDSGGIWIADKHRHRVSYYDYTGNPLFEFGGFGNKEGKFNHPSGIARFNDKIYVTDKLNHRVQVFSNDSSYIFSFGIKGDSAGQFNEPSGIASDRHGRIYITDRINNRIEVFDTTGEYIEYYGEEIELQHPCGILVDSFGYIFVVDEVNGKVWELDPFGDPICQFGEKGEGFGMLLFPQDVTISGDGEKIYVTDRVRKKVVIYDVYDKTGGGGMSAGDVETPIYNCLKACYPVPFSKGVTVSYSIAQKGYVSVKVYDVTGRLIRNLVQGIQDRGWYTIQWDGNDKSSRQVSSGVYFIRLEIDNFLSTKKVLLVK